MLINNCFGKIKRKVLRYAHCSIIANCRAKISAVFLGIFGIFHRIFKYMCIYYKICCRTPNDIMRNRGFP